MGSDPSLKKIEDSLKEISLWERLPYRSDSGGVRPMTIEGRCRMQVERLRGMTDEERKWRKQWLKDQELAPDEPREVPEIYKELRNPIRRFYLWPGNKLENALKRIMPPTPAFLVRFTIGKAFQVVIGTYIITYYFLFCTQDWTTTRRFRVRETRSSVLPGDPGYPFIPPKRTPQEWYDYGFKSSALYKDYINLQK